MNCIRSASLLRGHFLRLSGVNVSAQRCSSSDNVLIGINSDSGLATLTLAQPPVNSLNGEFLTNISDTIKKLEKDSSVSGILVTSKFHGKVFSAGLNILDMYNNSDAGLGEFWRCVQEWYLSVHNCSKPVVAAINGHAPAGGCAFGLMCDYRVMVEEKSIGLNETQLGIAAPFFFTDLMVHAIGIRQSELALNKGTLFTSKEALDVGLVDKVVDLDSVLPEAMAELAKLSKIPQPAFAATKSQFRGKNVEHLREVREQDIDTFVHFVQKPFVQKTLGNYLESLKGRRK